MNFQKFNLGQFGLAIHGGAGAPSKMSEEKAREYKAVLEATLKKGWSVLSDRGTSLDAVIAAVSNLEKSELFNAGGPGAVLNCEGKIRTDAGIMCGASLKAGGVADLRGVLNPSLVAKLVMEKTNTLLLTSEGAVEFAKENGIKVVEDENFYVTQARREQLLRAQSRDQSEMRMDHDSETETDESKSNKMGTVGVVAVDVHSNLSVVTSTGGRVNKPVGRIGDSPIPGAGYWADNKSLAVSTTGVGEAFMMSSASKYLALQYLENQNIEDAVKKTFFEIKKFQGYGGLVAITQQKEAILAYDTPAMFRAYMDDKGSFETLIF